MSLDASEELFPKNFIAAPEFDLLKRKNLGEFLVGHDQVRH